MILAGNEGTSVPSGYQTWRCISDSLHFMGTEELRSGGWENVFKIWNDHISKWARCCHLCCFRKDASRPWLVLSRHFAQPILLVIFLKAILKASLPPGEVWVLRLRGASWVARFFHPTEAIPEECWTSRSSTEISGFDFVSCETAFSLLMYSNYSGWNSQNCWSSSGTLFLLKMNELVLRFQTNIELHVKIQSQTQSRTTA